MQWAITKPDIITIAGCIVDRRIGVKFVSVVRACVKLMCNTVGDFDRSLNLPVI